MYWPRHADRPTAREIWAAIDMQTPLTTTTASDRGEDGEAIGDDPWRREAERERIKVDTGE